VERGNLLPDAKGEVQVRSPRKNESTKVGNRGGTARNSEEIPVMGVERRGCVIQFKLKINRLLNGRNL
jgi:hypothetical protein